MRPLLALVLLVLFYAIALGLRTWQHLRATGETGFHGVSGRPGSLEWLGGVLFVLGILFSLAATIGELLGWLPPAWEPGLLASTLGAAITAVGVLATYLAQVSMGDAWRIGVQTGERTRLVDSGPFAVVRNPIFACMFITSAGLAILLPNALSLAALAALFIGVELQVRFVEEPHLLRLHGDRYREYAARVGRFLPGLGLL
jgi:protein-S-isoprenylcysteine O-methyltransferase Ste14